MVTKLLTQLVRLPQESMQTGAIHPTQINCEYITARSGLSCDMAEWMRLCCDRRSESVWGSVWLREVSSVDCDVLPASVWFIVFGWLCVLPAVKFRSRRHNNYDDNKWI
jgi:hypothetical protein